MRERALIVHPRFRHTLADPPVAPADPPAPPTWAELPGEVVELIALHLEQPQDVLALAAVCRDARCAWEGEGRTRHEQRVQEAAACAVASGATSASDLLCARDLLHEGIAR